MKRIINYIVLSFSIIFVGCHDILEIEPNDRITGIWENEALVQAYVTGMYTSIEHGYGTSMLGSLIDEMYDLHNNGNVWTVQRGEITPDNVYNVSPNGANSQFNKWGFAYSKIRDINNFLIKIQLTDFDSELVNHLEGEMRFIRAYLYSELLWRYGGIPIITNVFALDDNFSDVKRETYDNTVDFIVKELNDVAILLRSKAESDKGRVNIDVALALKSRVLLYAASPLNNPNNDKAKWQKAAEAAEVLLNKYSLFEDYQYLFLEDNDEIIFARYFTTSLDHRINGNSGISSKGGSGHNTPTENIAMDYEMVNGELPYSLDDNLNIIPNPSSGFDIKNPFLNRDPRFYASIFYDGSKFQEVEIETWSGGIDSPLGDMAGWNASMTSYYLKKFIDPTKSMNQRSDDTNTNPWIYFRYAEILLNYAEAKFELGDEDAARDYVNMVRGRVNMPPITSTGDELRKKIHHERRIELAFEGHRFFDVRRWGILDEALSKQILGMFITKNSDGTKHYEVKQVNPSLFFERHYRLPIPRTEIDRSGGSLDQNPGYKDKL